MSFRSLALTMLAGAVVATACTIVTGLHTQPPPSPANAPLDTCAHATVPPAPGFVAEKGDKEIVVAARRFDLGLGEGAPVVGFDLDGTCTCSGDAGGGDAGGGEKYGESCVTTTRHCDDSEGRDNATSGLLDQLGPFFDVAANLNAGVERGASTLLLRVQGYNGLENDSDVIVSVFGSPGIRLNLGDGGTDFAKPANDGKDKWSVSEKQLTKPLEAYVSSDFRKGYVSSYKLVVPGASASLPFAAGASLRVVDAVVVATIDPNGPTITEATIAGRWPVADALRASGELSIGGNGGPICEDPFFDTVKKTLCPAADLARSPDAGSSAPCEALSAAIHFTTGPAALGEIVNLPLVPARCHDDSIFRCQ